MEQTQQAIPDAAMSTSPIPPVLAPVLMMAFWVLLGGAAGIKIMQSIWHILGVGVGEIAIAVPVGGVVGAVVGGLLGLIRNPNLLVLLMAMFAGSAAGAVAGKVPWGDIGGKSAVKSPVAWWGVLLGLPGCSFGTTRSNGIVTESLATAESCKTDSSCRELRHARRRHAIEGLRIFPAEDWTYFQGALESSSLSFNNRPLRRFVRAIFWPAFARTCGIPGHNAWSVTASRDLHNNASVKLGNIAESVARDLSRTPPASRHRHESAHCVGENGHGVELDLSIRQNGKKFAAFAHSERRDAHQC